jgi:hypothetical protein
MGIRSHARRRNISKWGVRREGRLPKRVMKELAITLLVCCWVATSSAQAIECLSAPSQSGSGWWSWREIDGRKCWYKKVGEIPPKSDFIWRENAKEATPVEVPAQQSSSMQTTEGTTASLPQIEVARVKPVDLANPNFRLSDARVGLIEGFNLAGNRGVGGSWEMPAYSEFPPDTFDARYGRW